ncbi:MAG TPA: hypothetical protein VKN18_26545 [Blastocatellia bacterium]|nr:hypothetical protein [Blastocatellia bacterium]
MNKLHVRYQRLVTSIALLLLLTTIAGAQDLSPKFEEYMDKLAKPNRFIGSVLVARDGKILFSKG